MYSAGDAVAKVDGYIISVKDAESAVGQKRLVRIDEVGRTAGGRGADRPAAGEGGAPKPCRRAAEARQPRRRSEALPAKPLRQVARESRAAGRPRRAAGTPLTTPMRRLSRGRDEAAAGPRREPSRPRTRTAGPEAARDLTGTPRSPTARRSSRR